MIVPENSISFFFKKSGKLRCPRPWLTPEDSSQKDLGVAKSSKPGK